jgi:hypothetical protein
VKQRKIAISLAVIGAVAAPFAFHTYKARPMSRAFIPMTAAGSGATNQMPLQGKETLKAIYSE